MCCKKNTTLTVWSLHKGVFVSFPNLCIVNGVHKIIETPVSITALYASLCKSK